jgi:hypothetical protein
MGEKRGKNLQKDIHTKPNSHTVRHRRNKRRVQFPLQCYHFSGKSEESSHDNIQKIDIKTDIEKDKYFVILFILYFKRIFILLCEK